MSADDSTLLVLGAGASIGAAKYPIESSLRQAMAKMPSGENFFYDLFHQGKMDTHGERYVNSLGLTCEGVNDLIVRAWGLEKNRTRFEPEEWRQINIEDVFTFLDIGEKMYSRGTPYQKGFRICKRDLASFVTFQLLFKSEGLHCERLLHLLCELRPTDSVISFNWDTIADFTLQRLGGPIYETYLDLMTTDKPRLRDYNSRGVFLKLHGSLNWRVCPNPQCPLHGKARLAVEDKKLLRLREMHKCPNCGNERCEPFIVPPTSNKLIRPGSILHKLWLIARQKLGSCRRIVFVGYSFPATDFYSEWLFRQIYFLEGNRPEIIVVNPAMKHKDSDVQRRYQRLFKGCKIRVFRDLKEFTRRGLKLLKRV
ncbi:MAG TPA: hypothetical protein VJA21_31705 [Verrucomicrobiae bacterium]